MRTASRTGLCVTFLSGVLTFTGVVVTGQQPARPDGGPATTGAGLIRNDPDAFQGYTLLSPLQSKSTFLIDMQGRVVRSWDTDATPSSIAHLLDSGNLLRPSLLADSPFGGRTAGAGGTVQEIAWNGDLVWDFNYVTQRCCPITT